MQELAGPGDHVVVTVPNYQSTESVPLAAGADVSGLVLDGAERLGARPGRRCASLLRPKTRLVAVNFPNNPTGAMPDPETFRALVDAVRRARHPAVQRRGLPRRRARPGAHAAAGRRPVGDGGLAQRDVEGLRPARAADRLGRLPRPRAAGAPGAAQALHVDLQCRARASCSRRSRCASARRPRARRGAIVAANLPVFDGVLRRSPRPLRVGAARTAAASASRGTSATTASRRSAASWWRRRASCSCRRASSRSALADVPGTASASALARRPRAGLAAFERFLG